MRDYCDAQAGFWLNSKFWSKFSRKPLSGIEDQKAPPPPFRKTSDLGWPKFTPEYPSPLFGKLQIWDDQSLLRNTPHFGKLQIWDDQSLLRNTPHFGKLQIWDDQSLLWNTPPFNENCQRVQVRDFQNTESYYVWRLYPTRITTSLLIVAHEVSAAGVSDRNRWDRSETIDVKRRHFTCCRRSQRANTTSSWQLTLIEATYSWPWRDLDLKAIHHHFF